MLKAGHENLRTHHIYNRPHYIDEGRTLNFIKTFHAIAAMPSGERLCTDITEMIYHYYDYRNA